MKLLLSLSFCLLFLLISVHGQEELPASGDGSGEGSGSVAGSGSGDGESAAEASGESEAEGEEGSASEEGEGSEENEEASSDSPADEEGSGEDGSGDEIQDILKPKSESSGDEQEEGDEEESDSESDDEDTDSESDDEDTDSESDDEDSDSESDNENSDSESDEEEEMDHGTCDMEGMDEKVQECMSSYDSRIKKLEGTISSGEGGGLEDQIELVLVKKGVIDCENDTQCDDNRACLESRVKRDRVLCEDPCERIYCRVQHSECLVSDHKYACECKEGFHGNGTERCFPDGFTAEDNGRHYRIFDESYVTFENATQQCQELGAQLPVLDSQETIKIVRKYLEQSNFTVFEQWDRSSRRVWLGLIVSPRNGLIWIDGARIRDYKVSSKLFVWEARRLLSVESSYADHTRHYGLYIDGDIAKLPGGGRKGAAVLCELLPEPEPQQPSIPYPQDYRQQPQQQQQNSPYPQQRSQQPYYPQQQQQQPPSQPQRPHQNYNSYS